MSPDHYLVLAAILFVIGALGVLLLLDLIVISRRTHEPSVRECVWWVGGYAGGGGGVSSAAGKTLRFPRRPSPCRP